MSRFTSPKRLQYNLLHKTRTINRLMLVVFLIQAIFSVSLIFNDNIWFDEAFTLSLIQHDFPQVIDIIKSDMHPPLYFITLKIFCMIFGYSVPVTKLFSFIGYLGTLLLGLTIIRKHFSDKTAIIYMLTIGSIPMSLYFSVQQRSYQWGIFFVTFCFLESILFLGKEKICHGVFMVVTGLLASYNHFYALLAVGVIFAFINIYIMIKLRKQIKTIILLDLCMLVGYSPWIFVLCNQVSNASNSFWLKGIEPLSVIVFISGIIFSILILLKKENRKLLYLFSITTVLGVQLIGLLVTVFIRPFYIARYSVFVLGVFAFFIAIVIQDLKTRCKTIIIALICMLNIICFIGTVKFEYNTSMSDCIIRLNQSVSKEDTFLYCDSSFGMMSYYYPQNEHICIYSQSWFEAFNNVKCIDKSQMSQRLSFDNKVWFIKNDLTKMPKCLTSSYSLDKVDGFQCDFNHFEVYAVTEK